MKDTRRPLDYPARRACSLGGRGRSALLLNTRRGAAPRQASNERAKHTPAVCRFVSVSCIAHHALHPNRVASPIIGCLLELPNLKSSSALSDFPTRRAQTVR